MENLKKDERKSCNPIVNGVRTPSHKLHFTIWCYIRLSFYQLGSFYDYRKDSTLIFCLHIKKTLVELYMYISTLISPLRISKGHCMMKLVHQIYT